MNLLFKRIFDHPTLTAKPPVLIDIGASGGIHPKWRKIAEYSTCIAFDKNIENDPGIKKSFKKLHIIPSLVTDHEQAAAQFHITQSPQCSSLLAPDEESLKEWAFSDYFKVRSVETVKTLTLESVLKQTKVGHIDWFKTDSQGLDLRLFTSLNANLRQFILAAEFEPGFIDAYRSEDKLFKLLEFMDTKDFWMMDIRVKGDYRIPKEILDSHFEGLHRRFRPAFMKQSPGWAEITYFNSFRNPALTVREYLLGWVFAAQEGHHEFALQLALKGTERFGDPLFEELKTSSLKTIKGNFYKIPVTVFRKMIGQS